MIYLVSILFSLIEMHAFVMKYICFYQFSHLNLIHSKSYQFNYFSKTIILTCFSIINVLYSIALCFSFTHTKDNHFLLKNVLFVDYFLSAY